MLGIIAVVVFACTVPVTRLAVQSLDPFFVTALRALFGGVGALAALLVMRAPQPTSDAWAPLAIIAFCVVLGYPICAAIALTSVPASHSGVVLGIMPIATAVAAAVIAGERPSFGFWMIGLLGAALVVAFALRHGGAGAFAAGDVLLGAAVVCGAVGYTLSGRLARTMPGWLIISWCLVIVLPIAILATGLLWPRDAAVVPARAWIEVAFLGLFPQFIGFFFWNKSLAIGGIARVSQIQLIQTFVILGLAAVLNGESIDAETLVFATAVVAVVVAGQRMRVRVR